MNFLLCPFSDTKLTQTLDFYLGTQPVYLTKREDFSTMNDAYGQFVSAHTSGDVLPSRTTVFTGLPREEMLVEIDAVAIL